MVEPLISWHISCVAQNPDNLLRVSDESFPHLKYFLWTSWWESEEFHRIFSLLLLYCSDVDIQNFRRFPPSAIVSCTTCWPKKLVSKGYLKVCGGCCEKIISVTGSPLGEGRQGCSTTCGLHTPTFLSKITNTNNQTINRQTNKQTNGKHCKFKQRTSSSPDNQWILTIDHKKL